MSIVNLIEEANSNSADYIQIKESPHQGIFAQKQNSDPKQTKGNHVLFTFSQALFKTTAHLPSQGSKESCGGYFEDSSVLKWHADNAEKNWAKTSPFHSTSKEQTNMQAELVPSSLLLTKDLGRDLVTLVAKA